MNAQIEERRNERRNGLRRDALPGSDVLNSEVRAAQNQFTNCTSGHLFDLESHKRPMKNVPSEKYYHRIVICSHGSQKEEEESGKECEKHQK